MLKLKKNSITLKKNNLFLFLASGVVNDQGFWLIGIKNSDVNILDDKTLLECHRKELVGIDSAKVIIDAINLNLKNLINDVKNNHLPLDEPPIGIPYGDSLGSPMGMPYRDPIWGSPIGFPYRDPL